MTVSQKEFAFKLNIKVGKVNIAAPERGRYDQDYFVGLGEGLVDGVAVKNKPQWIDGVTVNDNPRRVRQFVAYVPGSG